MDWSELPFVLTRVFLGHIYTRKCRADSRFVHSQWEPSLQSNAVSHWLGTPRISPESVQINTVQYSMGCSVSKKKNSRKAMVHHYIILWTSVTVSYQIAWLKTQLSFMHNVVWVTAHMSHMWLLGEAVSQKKLLFNILIWEEIIPRSRFSE